MAHPKFMTTARTGLAGAAMAGIAACGGDVVALLAIVTPLGGSWSDGGTESIAFTAPSEPEQMFASNLAVLATVTSSKGVCGATTTSPQVDNIPGTLNNGQLTLRLSNAAAPCLEGRFTDLRRLEASAPGLPAKVAYLNDRVAVNLQTGVWVGEGGSPTLKFTAPSSVDNGSTSAVAGCDVSNPAAKLNFTGTMTGFNATTLAKPRIAALVGTAFTNVEFVSGATLTMTNGSQNVTLTRQGDPAGTTC